MNSMRPTEIRSRILRNHAELRDTLGVLRELATEANAGSRAAGERAIELSNSLFERLADHLGTEEQLLVPFLREADAWGEQRANELVRLHEQQWQELKGLRERAASGTNVCTVAGELAAMVDALRSDILEEDRQIVEGDVLRDDVLGIDVEDG